MHLLDTTKALNVNIRVEISGNTMDWNYLHEIYKQFPQENDATNLLHELDNLLVDWESFFLLYMAHASPPKENIEAIQKWFKELRGQHRKCILLYNKTLNRAINTNFGEFSLMFNQPNLNKKDKDSNNTSDEDIGYI